VKRRTASSLASTRGFLYYNTVLFSKFRLLFETFRPGKTGLHFLKFRCSLKFSTGKTRKVLLHLFSNRTCRKLVNGKQLVTSLRLWIIILCRSLIFFGLSGVAIVNDYFVTKSGKKKITTFCKTRPKIKFNHKVFLTKPQWKRNITVQLMYALQLKTKKETEVIFRTDECWAEQEYKASAHMGYCLCVFWQISI